MIRKIIGYLLISVPFVCLGALIVRKDGWYTLGLMLLVLLGMAVCVFGGLYLSTTRHGNR